MVSKTRILDTYDAIRSTYWFFPLIISIIAVILAIVVSHFDQTIPADLIQRLFFVFHINLNNVHSTLITLATAQIGVIGVVFSITLVPLTISTSSYGSVILRVFLRDLSTQIVLGAYSASIAYDLATIIILSNGSFLNVIPVLSVTTGFIFFIFDLALLIYFFQHVASLLQAANIIALLGISLDKSIRSNILPGSPSDSGKTEPIKHAENGPSEQQVILSRKTGYIRLVDYETLMDIAKKKDQVLHVHCYAGNFVNAGDPMLRASPGRLDDRTVKLLQRSFYIGNFRTMRQDPKFGISILVNIAARALSPAVNESIIPVMVLNRLGVALSLIAEKGDRVGDRVDDMGHPRIIVQTDAFKDLVDNSFNLIRQYGRGNADLFIAMLNTISKIAPHIRTEHQRLVLLHYASLVKGEISNGVPAGYDRQRIEEAYDNTVHALNGSSPVQRTPDA